MDGIIEQGKSREGGGSIAWGNAARKAIAKVVHALKGPDNIVQGNALGAEGIVK